ncbi:MAG: tRNA-dihydrouridine synthase family protein [Victivallaceae bacterium]|nr:tRNA-dihydrouridine synthase family protein [Victivallaceae bacterium]
MISARPACGENTFVFASGLNFPRFFPGPMEGVITPLFCRAFHQLRLTDGWLTPYYRVTTNVPKPARLKKFLQPYLHAGLPVIGQVMGTSPALLAAVAKCLAELGIKGVNLNFACPSRQVLRSGAGGALLRNISLMTEILHTVKNVLPEVSLSVKLRSGCADWRESERIIPALAGTGTLDFIGVHYRTVGELYLPVTLRAERFRCLTAWAGKVPVIASGDMFSEEDVRDCLGTGCTGAMIARGLLRDPFLIRNFRSVGRAGPAAEANRRYFFRTLQEIARTERKLYCRGKFLEYAGMMWGMNSDRFLELKRLTDKELLDFEFNTELHSNS